ncbi:hypothetical protein N7488_011922 [Penicillium malachiteum]|nr:hypothetical protein N7488_011922 [Penicillium malachiteum]
MSQNWVRKYNIEKLGLDHSEMKDLAECYNHQLQEVMAAAHRKEVSISSDAQMLLRKHIGL